MAILYTPDGFQSEVNFQGGRMVKIIVRGENITVILEVEGDATSFTLTTEHYYRHLMASFRDDLIEICDKLNV